MIIIISAKNMYIIWEDRLEGFVSRENLDFSWIIVHFSGISTRETASAAMPIFSSCKEKYEGGHRI